MKRITVFILCAFWLTTTRAQITTAIIKAGFGVDGDLKTCFGMPLSKDDDWFPNNCSYYVIDTTGAAAMVAQYIANPSSRYATFYRPMSRPAYSVNNNKLWLDGLFVRDYHGNDTTAFSSGANTNGMSPASWTGDVQPVPNKNDILDVFEHMRRAGDGTHSTDSLWLFGGLSLASTSGDRYFDFEMYQTDIYYDRTSKSWYGYGPDAGHTSWKFDATGHIIQAGDVIFSAYYQNSTLTSLECRIWIDRSSLSITPATFNWSGNFDGATNNSQFGYASIAPNTNGAFYTGLTSAANTWAGPYQLVLGDNSLATTYAQDQFMEFSVNLTKLGLDPATLPGGDFCGSPFNRIVVKTRTSLSFTSQLKDFVAPLDLFLAPRAQVAANVPFFCGTIGVSNLMVTDPYPTSVYTWSTPNGDIVGTTSGTSITVDQPGTYILKQQLANGCNPYAFDTLTILYDPTCVPMQVSGLDLKAVLKNNVPVLSWNSPVNDKVSYYEVQRSTDGTHFETIQTVPNPNPENASQTIDFTDRSNTGGLSLYYRIRAIEFNHAILLSKIGKLNLAAMASLQMIPNPASSQVQLTITVNNQQKVKVQVIDLLGTRVFEQTFLANQGKNTLLINDVSKWSAGVYMVTTTCDEGQQWQKLVVQKK